MGSGVKRDETHWVVAGLLAAAVVYVTAARRGR